MTSPMSRFRKKPMKVFLSHSYADIRMARQIRNVLRNCGFDVKMHEDLGFGESSLQQLRDEIEACDMFVPLITPDSVHDSWLLQETGAAWGLYKPILPVVTRRDTLNEFPIAISRHVALQPGDLNKKETAERFARDIEEALAAPHA